MGKGSWIVRLAMALAILVGAADAGWAQPLISLGEYRDRVAAEIRRQLPTARIVLLGQVGLQVTQSGDEAKDQSMEPSYAVYRADPRRLDELVGQISRSFIPAPLTAQSLRVLFPANRRVWRAARGWHRAWWSTRPSGVPAS